VTQQRESPLRERESGSKRVLISGKTQPVSNTEEINEKLVHLESVIAHLQYEIEQLNSVVIEQNQRIDRLSSAQEKFEHRLESLSEDLEQRNPEDERPPHY